MTYLPNIKSAIKRVQVTETKTLQNSMRKSALKTSVRRFNETIQSGDTDNANMALKKAIELIDKAVKTGILHKNTAARKKSSLQKSCNSILNVK